MKKTIITQPPVVNLPHNKQDHLRSLKNSIPYSQLLRVKLITAIEYYKNPVTIMLKCIDRQHKEKALNEKDPLSLLFF